MIDLYTNLLSECQNRIDGLNVISEPSDQPNQQVFILYFWPDLSQITAWRFKIVFTDPETISIYFKTPEENKDADFRMLDVDLLSIMEKQTAYLSATSKQRPKMILKQLVPLAEKQLGIQTLPSTAQPPKLTDKTKKIIQSKTKNAKKHTEIDHKIAIINSLAYASRYLAYGNITDLGDRCRIGGIRLKKDKMSNTLKADFIARLSPFVETIEHHAFGLLLTSYEIQYKQLPEPAIFFKRLYECLVHHSPYSIHTITKDINQIMKKNGINLSFKSVPK